MVVDYFHKIINNLSRLVYYSVRNGQEEAQGIGFDGCFDQSLNKESQTSAFRANGVNDGATNVEGK